MRRWHSEREHAIMFARWKQEMGLHRYDWRNPPDPKCDRNACHCAAGIGSMRKRTPLGCSKPGCVICHWDKLFFGEGVDRYNKRRQAIQFELEANQDQWQGLV